MYSRAPWDGCRGAPGRVSVRGMTLRSLPAGRIGPLPAVDVGLAGVLLVGVAVQLAVDSTYAGESWTVVISFLGVPLVACRRRWPLLSATGFALLVALQEVFEGKTASNPLALFIATLLIAYSVGAHLPLARSLAGLSVLVLVEFGVALHEGLGATSDWAAGMIVNVALWLVGRSVRASLGRVRGLEVHVMTLERDRERREREAIAAERGRIARELHDVISHSVSLMVVQAAGGEVMFAQEPRRALEALTLVQSTGRKAIEDLSRLLAVLREADGEPELGPEPSLDHLEELVARVRDAGVAVDVAVDGESGSVSPGLDAAAFRIVQEGLTNVLKHANATRVDVVLRRRRAWLEIEIVDNGSGNGNGGGTGHGLLGMRQRVEVFGGRLEAGQRPSGGFAVRAHLPIEGS